jgi:mannosyltransferase
MDEGGWARRIGLVGWIVAIGAGLVLRFVQVSPLWLDEALSVNIASLPLGEIPEALRHDGHPPLYYFLLHGWMSLVGSGDAAVRALSGLISLAVVGVAGIIGSRLGGRRMAQATVLLVLSNPFVARYATEVRMYSLVMLLVLLGWLATQAALRNPSLGRLTLIALLSGTLVLAHYWALWLLVATEVGLVILYWRHPRANPDRPSPPRPNIVRVALAIPCGAVLVIPWLPSMLEQLRHTGTPWGEAIRPTSALGITLIDLAGVRPPEVILLAGALAALIVLGLFAHRDRLAADELRVDLERTGPLRWEALTVVLTLVIGGSVAFVAGSAFQSRYASVSVPLILLVAAAGLTALPRRTALIAIVGTVGLGLAVSAVGAVHFERTQAREIADAIDADGAREGDVVVYCPDQLGPAVDRLLDERLTGLAYPTLGSPERVDWVDYSERNDAADPTAIASEIEQRADGHRVYLVWAIGYRTFGRQCERLFAELAATRTGRTLVRADSKFYEPSALTVFDAS